MPGTQVLGDKWLSFFFFGDGHTQAGTNTERKKERKTPL